MDSNSLLLNLKDYAVKRSLGQSEHKFNSAALFPTAVAASSPEP